MFLGVDPLAEKYAFQSPFAYAANNPIKFVDVLGMGPGDPPGFWGSIGQGFSTYGSKWVDMAKDAKDASIAVVKTTGKVLDKIKRAYTGEYGVILHSSSGGSGEDYGFKPDHPIEIDFVDMDIIQEVSDLIEVKPNLKTPTKSLTEEMNTSKNTKTNMNDMAGNVDALNAPNATLMKNDEFLGPDVRKGLKTGGVTQLNDSTTIHRTHESLGDGRWRTIEVDTVYTTDIK